MIDLDRIVAALVVIFAIWLLLVAGLVVAGRGALARELATLLPNLLFLFRGLLRDRRVPLGSKLLLAGAVVYIASPIDLVPEFIPVAGPLDDAIVAALVLRRVVRAAGREVVREHWRGDPRTLERIFRLAGLRSAA